MMGYHHQELWYPQELWMQVPDNVQEAVIKTSPRKRYAKSKMVV